MEGVKGKEPYGHGVEALIRLHLKAALSIGLVHMNQFSFTFKTHLRRVSLTCIFLKALALMADGGLKVHN